MCLSEYVSVCVCWCVSMWVCMCLNFEKGKLAHMYYIRFQTLIVIFRYIKGKNEHNTLEFIHYKVALL